jgi:hypothetical protein
MRISRAPYGSAGRWTLTNASTCTYFVKQIGRIIAGGDLAAAFSLRLGMFESGAGGGVPLCCPTDLSQTQWLVPQTPSGRVLNCSDRTGDIHSSRYTVPGQEPSCQLHFVFDPFLRCHRIPGLAQFWYIYFQFRLSRSHTAR